MDILSLAEFGPAIFAIAAIVFIVIKNQAATKELTENFMKLITNHLHDHKTSLDKNTGAIDRLEDVMRDVSTFIKRLNGGKK
jgi:hypothetical protein